jgi:DNA polymerase I-like protein with 3'-5' exonuclease and polymerase domains
VQAAVKAKGHLIGLDGGRIPVRSAHSALNSLLQSAGAIVAKWWIVEAFDAFAREGWVYGRDFLLRAWIHDELQFSVRPEIADAFGKVCVAAIESCGIKLNLRLPITGKSKRGKSWLDCH